MPEHHPEDLGGTAGEFVQTMSWIGRNQKLQQCYVFLLYWKRIQSADMLSVGTVVIMLYSARSEIWKNLRKTKQK